MVCERRRYIARKMANGGIFFPYSKDGPYQFVPPKHLTACSTVALGDASEARATDAKNIASKLYLDWGHASAHHSKRISVAADGESQRLPACADKVVHQCAVCQASEKAFRLPANGGKPAWSWLSCRCQTILPLAVARAMGTRHFELTQECVSTLPGSGHDSTHTRPSLWPYSHAPKRPWPWRTVPRRVAGG